MFTDIFVLALKAAFFFITHFHLSHSPANVFLKIRHAVGQEDSAAFVLRTISICVTPARLISDKGLASSCSYK